MTDLFTNFLSNLDVVEFVEQNLILEGKPFLYTDNGRDFAKEIMRYSCHILPYSKKSRPIVVLKGRQVGLSTLTAAIMLYFMYNQQNKSFLHAFPEVGQARKFSAKRLIEMIEDSIKKSKLPGNFLNKGGSQSLTQKDFHKNNTLYIEGTSVDGRRLRGVSISGLCCMDEFGTMTEEAFRNVLECSSNTHFGYVNNGKQLPHLVFGTPLNEGSLFHKVWEKSNKQKFFFKCPKCAHEFPLFYNLINREEVFTNLVTGTLIKCLDEDGVGCQAICDKVREMPKGKWKPTVPDELCDYVGFEVPQFLNGAISRESIEGKRKELSTRTFYNEVLGKFYSFEEDVLTKQDIIRLTTTNPNTKDWDLAPHVIDKQTFMGIDWGGRVSGVEDTGVGSYTVVTVFSLLPTGHIKLEHASRLTSSDTDDKVKAITELMRKFNVKKVIADKGYGQSECQRLQKLHGADKFTSCEWSGNIKKVYNYHEDINTVRVDKHVIHEIFFDELRQGKLCFPYSLKAEQELEWLLDHMTNIEVTNVESNGIIKRQYNKKTGRETDGLASLIYAYTAFQFWKTKGFINFNQISQSGQSGFSGQGKSGLQPYIVRSSGGKVGGGNRSPVYSRSDRRRR